MEQDDVHRLLRTVLDILQKKGVFTPKDNSKLVDFQQPEALEKLLSNFALSESCSECELLELIEKTAELSVHTRHPMFYNQLYGGVDKYGLAGAIVSEVLNTSAYTHEVAPVFSLSEREVMKASLRLVGFEQGDGIFAPGGSISNMFGIVLSRYRKFPKVKQTGVFSLSPLVLFTSEESHYSITKGAHWLGLGTDNVIKVKCDGRGRMIPAALEDEIQKTLNDGKTPLFVNATAGSTVLGAFDPLNDIAEICRQHGIWLHVDDLLKQCNAAGATYLFQKDKMYDPSYDSGDKSVQCGRKVDSFKLWTLWKARGNRGLGEQVDKALTLSKYFFERIRHRPGFRLVLEEYETTNVCFWYIPSRLRDQEETPEWWDQIHKVAPTVKRKLVEAGEMMVGYQPLEYRGLKNFFRMVLTCHPIRSTQQIDRAIDLFEKYGDEL